MAEPQKAKAQTEPPPPLASQPMIWVERDLGTDKPYPHALWVDEHLGGTTDDDGADAIEALIAEAAEAERLRAEVESLTERLAAEVLPPGVYRCGPFAYLAGGWTVPDGWERVETDNRGSSAAPTSIRRIPPAPTTERVPWWEAQGRAVMIGDERQEVARVAADPFGPYLQVTPHLCTERDLIAEDGTVEVLVDAGGES